MSRGDVIQKGERYALRMLARCCPLPHPVIFDVGANIGEYTEEVLRYLPRANVRCFEPVRETYMALTRYALDHDWKAKLENIALSDVNGRLDFFATETPCCYLPGLYRVFDEPSGLPLNKKVLVAALTLDTYCDGFDVAHVNWLKLDVEGHELAVLTGARRMLQANKIDIIQFEMADVAALAGWSFRDMWLLLKPYGFKFYLENDKSIVPIDNSDYRYDDLKDFYVNILAVADHASWWVGG